MPVFSETSNPSSLSHCSLQKIKSHPATSSGSIKSGESNCLGLLCPCPFDDLPKIDEQSTPGSEKIPSLPHHHDGENLSMIFKLKSVLFFPPDSSCWMMVWKMESEAWYLNINFPDRHASPTGYLSPVLFFWGLICSRHLNITGLLFVKFKFGISLWVTELLLLADLNLLYITGLIIFLLTHICC